MGKNDEFAWTIAHRANRKKDYEELFAAPANRQQLLDFVQARKTGERPVADIQEGHISSACSIMANLSMELGRSLRWDAEAGKLWVTTKPIAAWRGLTVAHEVIQHRPSCRTSKRMLQT